jgi:hypothetical protein
MIDEASMDLTLFLVPWIALLLSLIATLWLKEWVTSLVKGMKFKMNKAFNEGMHVILDGKPAVIVKIGTTETVFGVYSDAGYTWRYVPNTKIENLKLEKIINKELHLDSPEEKARKLQALIDIGQDDRIKENKKAIDQLKNGN